MPQRRPSHVRWNAYHWRWIRLAPILKRRAVGWQTYLALWSTHRAKLLAQRSSSSLRNADSVTTTWVLVCQQLEKSNPQAIALLKLLAFLHPEGISEDILREGSALLGPELAAVMGDPWQMNEVIRESLRFSLLRRDAKSHALRMHRLFQ